MKLFNWLDERTGLVSCFEKIAEWTVPASFCFCRFLPVAIVFAFLLQGITGLFLWAFYAPSAQTAWESVFYIQYHLPYGWLVRGIHHFSAQLLVGSLGIYVLLMILHGSYRRPREFVYWSAVVMFLFSLASCLTGDLLNWSLSGYFATIARVSFLQVLPIIGVPLYQLVAGGPDPQFGTLTLTRFTVLHIAVFGGGFLLVMLFWKWSDIRSRGLMPFKGSAHHCALACGTKEKRTFWGWEAIFCAFTCVIFFAAVLVFVFHQSLIFGQIDNREPTLPAEAYLGAELTSPADPGGSYDAARPEWSFRALYYMSKLPIFSVIGMVFAIFVVPTCLGIWFFALPILARIKYAHALIVLITLGLFVVFCRFTYLSYYDDYSSPEHSKTFLSGKAEADHLKQRAVELAFAPEGISKDGALSLLKNDSFIQGPKLFQQHCLSCHNFMPMPGQQNDSDFKPMLCPEPSAPNLYGATTSFWMKGFHDKDRLISDHYFGKTTNFAKKGSMVGFVTGRVQGGAYTKDGSFILNESGLIYPLIGSDASLSFDILESCLTELAGNPKTKGSVEKGEYVPKLKEMVAAKFADQKFLDGIKCKVPQIVLEELKKVLDDVLADPEYIALLKDSDNIALIVEDKDPAAFLEETFLAKLCGNGEPIAKKDQKYIDRLRTAIVASCNEVANILYSESQLDKPRPLIEGRYAGLRKNAIPDMAWLTCTECHAFYGTEKDLACDLRGYMSKSWIAGIISDPSHKTYYGKKNDRMPAYRPAEGDPLLSENEIRLLAEWMHADWYRAMDIENKERLGNNADLLPNIFKKEKKEEF
ncbi:MAG: cytochrome b N-terminal domain-containing protein [Planctomycetia bacterium]|nr:cytochrome b N-terminal domain-containing protein [Planctomycetia bacterium]